MQYNTALITGFFPLVNISQLLLLEYLREWKPTVAWHSESDKVLKSDLFIYLLIYLFAYLFVKGKLIIKTYMHQNKLHYFLNCNFLCIKAIACTTCVQFQSSMHFAPACNSVFIINLIANFTYSGVSFVKVRLSPSQKICVVCKFFLVEFLS